MSADGSRSAELRKRTILHTLPRRSVTDTPMSTLPKITVITPVLNGAAHISETLESVLRQEYPALEYIVVDGGSTDGTLGIIRDYAARDDFRQRISLVICEPDRGMYDAIAKGFERASGDIGCCLHAGDLFECGGLSPVGACFSQHPEIQVVYHEGIVLVDGWKFPDVRQPNGVDTADLLAGHNLFRAGMFWRRSAYDAVGGLRRDLELAGDLDLRLRLSALFRLVRRPGHVSCVRMHLDQPPSLRDLYRHEMTQSITDFLAKKPIVKRALRTVQRTFKGTYRKLSRRWQRERLFFPVDFGDLPPPAATIPRGAGEIPRSPIDGKPAERLLFTTPDTRFGDRELNYIYLDERNGITITHPRIAADELDALYQKHYSSPPMELKLPTATSPYRQFDRIRGWERVLFKLPVGALARRLFPDAWSDNTLHELIGVLNGSGVDTARTLRFLDIGCFEGLLLDQVRSDTTWESSGLEPNSRAVAIAKGKGHRVWCGHAQDAGTLIPQAQQFDVIHMGQSIEHMDDPVSVLRHLQRLLAPGGTLVVSTPNLDSREIDWFGPTWAHWHPPYHRYIFSRKGLYALARQAGLLPARFQTFSNPNWTALSLVQNHMGLGGSASHAVHFDALIAKKAHRINFWKRIIWNRLGKGDYCFFAIKAAAGETRHD